jgi:hypothetical protein
MSKEGEIPEGLNKYEKISIVTGIAALLFFGPVGAAFAALDAIQITVIELYKRRRT